MKLPFNINLSIVDIELAVTLFLVLLAFIVYQQIWRHLSKRFKKTSSIIDMSFLNAIHGPFYFLLVVIAFNILMPYLADVFDGDLGKSEPYLKLIMPVGFAVFVLLVFNRFLSNVQATIIKILLLIVNIQLILINGNLKLIQAIP